MTKSIAVCARVVLLVVLFVQSFGHPNTYARDGIAAMFGFYQPGTSTAVISPTATAVSLTPTNTALPPAQTTSTISLPMPTNVQVPKVTLGCERGMVIVTQPATATALPPAAFPDRSALTPIPEQVRSGLTITAAPILPTQSVISIQQVATATAMVESSIQSPATPTAQLVTSSGSLLDRLTRNKPGAWGKKAFYVTLGGIYIILLALFLRLVFRLVRCPD